MSSERASKQANKRDSPHTVPVQWVSEWVCVSCEWAGRDRTEWKFSRVAHRQFHGTWLAFQLQPRLEIAFERFLSMEHVLCVCLCIHIARAPCRVDVTSNFKGGIWQHFPLFRLDILVYRTLFACVFLLDNECYEYLLLFVSESRQCRPNNFSVRHIGQSGGSIRVSIHLHVASIFIISIVLNVSVFLSIQLVPSFLCRFPIALTFSIHLYPLEIPLA